MRGITLLETGFLAGLLVLSLVLPLRMSFRSPQDAAIRKSCLKIIWAAQAFLALAAMVVLASSPFAPYATAFGLVGFLWCALALHRQFRHLKLS